jgi:uncharacterized protein YbcV (DUF1398 family)
MALSPAAISVMQECVARSHAETITFPEVVAKLTATGVEHYEADLLRGQNAYFLPSGEWHAEKLPVPGGGAAADFQAAGVESAVRAIQRGEIKYNEFLRRIMAAGCVRYFVYIAGRNTAYFGRRGEAYIERFPDPK